MSENQHDLDALKKISTPIVYDVIERYNLRPRTDGYMDHSIRSMFPSMGVMVAYACTGKIIGARPPGEGEKQVSMDEMWTYVQQASVPSVMVVQDLDQPAGLGCACFGDVAASILLRLGCVGAVTNGGVRDLQESKELGFHFFASAPVVGHGYVRYVEFDTPVEVGGLVVHPGDLIHGDEHGVLVIPKAVDLGKVIADAEKFLSSEASIKAYCRQDDFTVEGLFQRDQMHERNMGGH